MPNLILGRFAGERIRIAVPPSEKETEVWVSVADFRMERRYGDREPYAKLGIEAPRDVAIDREELWKKKQEGNGE